MRFPCVEVPDLIPFDWTVARCPGGFPTMTSTRPDFLQAALPPSCCLTGKTAGHRLSGGAPFVQVQPVALTGRRGVRRSFWGAGSQDLAVGALRQKARWQTPHMCLVPPAGPTATAMTETRGAATRGVRTRLVRTVTTGSRKSGPVEAIYVFRRLKVPCMCYSPFSRRPIPDVVATAWRSKWQLRCRSVRRR